MPSHGLHGAESGEDYRSFSDHPLVARLTLGVLGLQPSLHTRHKTMSFRNFYNGQTDGRGFFSPETAYGHMHLQMELSRFTSTRAHAHVQSLLPHSN